MSRVKFVVPGLIAFVFAVQVANAENPGGAKQAGTSRPQMALISAPLSFEPNVGQSKAPARFLAHGVGYAVELNPSRARIAIGKNDSLTLDLVNGRGNAAIEGRELLPGKANYFPTSDPKSWHADIPTYARVRTVDVYPGVDVEFYGDPARLEYDFLLRPGADPALIRMALSGAHNVTVNQNGDLVLHFAAGNMDLLKPVAWQLSGDGKTRTPVQAGYRLEQAAKGKPAMLTLALGAYDHSKPLTIDPALVSSESLMWAEYLTQGNVASVAADSNGNSYVTGSASAGFYVTEFNPAGTMVYNANIGTGTIYPYGIAVDGTGRAYVAGYINSGATIPTSTTSYQKTQPSATANALYVQIAAGGGSVPYATYLGGKDSQSSYAYSIAVDSSGNSYIAGYTYSASFPATSGVYQATRSGGAGNYNGFVAKFNPAAATAAASLVYSTYLGPPGTTLNAVGVDGSGDAYVTGNAPTGFPVTNGAFQYAGYEAGSGGVYVTELNPTATAPLLYSAYLGYGTANGIAVDGSGDAYVTGTVGYDDFPTTPGAWQIAYPGGFVTEVAPGGATEVYSTFLGGPTSYAESNVTPSSISLPHGCSSNCNAYVAGYTQTTDFPAVNAFQANPSMSGHSAFVVELAGGGGSALLSSYLSGLNGALVGPNNSSTNTPAIALDLSGNIFVAGNLGGGANDFPVTLPFTTPSTAFLAKIGPGQLGFVWGTPSSINFGSQPVGISTSIDSATQTVLLRNVSATPVTLQPIQVTPSSIFAESDNCNGAIPAGGYCTLNIDFTPGASGARSGSVTVTSNASDGAIVIPVTGTGYDTPYIQVSTASLTFSTQNVGTSSPSQQVMLTNLGDQTASLGVYNYYDVNSGQTDFTEVSNCPSLLQPGSSCVVNETFTPTQSGLRLDTLYVTVSGGRTAAVQLTGAGVVPGAAASLVLSATSLNLGDEAVGATTGATRVYLTNNGSQPVVIELFAAAGDFSIYNNSCGATPFQMAPQQQCYVSVTFSPSTTGVRNGSLTIVDDDPSSVYLIPLTGNGLASDQTIEFNPMTTTVFPDQPVGTPSGPQTVLAFNTGTSPLTIYRVVVSGPFQIISPNCVGAVLPGTLTDGSSSTSNQYCSMGLEFVPTTLGPQTGMLTFYDSSPGSPHTVSLSGNGIAATGSLALTEDSINFGPEINGVASAAQNTYLVNAGDSPVTVTSASTGTSDFAIQYVNCATPPFTLQPGQTNCYVSITFTPTVTSAPPGTTRTGTLTVTSSAGSPTASLTGIGLTSAQALGATPTAVSFGSVVTGQNSGNFANYAIYLRNTGTAPVTFGDDGALTGTNIGDFTITNQTCPTSSGQLQPGASCYVYLTFTPGAAGSRTATVTFHSTAPAVAVTLSGTGVSRTPNYQLYPATLPFNQQPMGTTSASSQVTFTNNLSTAVILGNVAYTGSFATAAGSNNDSCSGQTVSASGSCTVNAVFAPIAAGYQTGTLTIKNSANTALASATLSGFALTPAPAAILDPSAVTFTQDQVVDTTSPNGQNISLENTGNVPLTVATVTGSDLSGSPSNDFSITTNGGSDGCSGMTIQAGSNCSVTIYFTPATTGTLTSTVVFPVTYNYTGGATANITGSVTATAVAVKDAAELSPLKASFVDTAVGLFAPNSSTLTLFNAGNQQLTVGPLTGTNVVVGLTTKADFTTAAANGGSDGCSNQPVAPDTGCSVTVVFGPGATGTRTGTLTFPVTYADKTTASPAATLTGNGVAAGKSLQIEPAGIVFPVQIKGTGTSGNAQNVTVTNNGNLPVQIGTDTTTTDFPVYSDSCAKSPLNAGQSCTISVYYAPTVTGPESGTLTINDNAAGGPHTVALNGTAIPANQQIAVSQTSLNFGSQAGGTSSSPQVITFTNQGDATVVTFKATFGGSNASSYQFTNNCGNTLPARSSCTMSFVFSPAAAANGTLSASLSINTSVTGETPIAIGITGTAVPQGPFATISPAALVFAQQNVGTTSRPQKFSVTNTGSANLTITNITSSDPTEFPLSRDGCSGATLTPNQSCTVDAKFDPTWGGFRSSFFSIFEDLLPPMTIGVTGTGYGIPRVVLTPNELTFTSQNIGATSAPQTVTLSNPGTDTLNIANIGVQSTVTGEFAISANTCVATLAPAATCTVSVTFTPSAANTRVAGLAVTDNAGNLANSTQIAGLQGTGVAVPQVTGLPPSITFSTPQNIGTTSTAQVVAMTNNGTGHLSIAGIVLGGTNPGDFAQTNNCGQALPKNTSCKISVTFSPTGAGTRSATITITDNAGNVTGTQQTINLSGTGQPVPGGVILVGSVNFGNQNVGGSSAPLAVSFTNGGTGPLTISTIAIGGANMADFLLSPAGTCPMSPSTLAVAASCAINITFTPATFGSRAATLTITDNAGNVAGTTQTVSLAGNGLEPLAVRSVTTLAFGNENLNVPTAVKTVTLSNTGNATLAISSIVLAGTDPGDYSQTNTCATNVAAGKSCIISVKFNPQALGSRPATLMVTDNNANIFGSVQSVTLSGAGVQVPVAGVTPTTAYAFASTNVGQPNSSLIVTVSNTGEAALSIASFTFKGTDPGDFSVSSAGTCPAPPTAVAVNTSCTVVVTFTPQAAGARSGTFVVTDNNLGTVGSTQSVTMTGTGLAPKATLSPALTFTTQSVGTSSAFKAVTLANSGTEAMTITAIGFAGTDPGDFSETDTCAAGTYPATLAIGKSCTINVTFKPTFSGARPATLVVTDNSAGFPGATQSVVVTGTGSAPEVSITPTNLIVTFLPQTLGTISTAQTVTLKNTGSATLSIGGVTVGGANPVDFPFTDKCVAALAASVSCTVTVQFKPSVTGPESATLKFTDNANNVANTTQTVTLNGTGQ